LVSTVAAAATTATASAASIDGEKSKGESGK
jgi:hypothetical protein